MSLSFSPANIVAALTVPAQSARKNGQPIATSGYDDAKIAKLASTIQENPFQNYPYRACAALGIFGEPSRSPGSRDPAGRLSSNRGGMSSFLFAPIFVSSSRELTYPGDR